MLARAGDILLPVRASRRKSSLLASLSRRNAHREKSRICRSRDGLADSTIVAIGVQRRSISDRSLSRLPPLRKQSGQGSAPFRESRIKSIERSASRARSFESCKLSSGALGFLNHAGLRETAEKSAPAVDSALRADTHTAILISFQVSTSLAARVRPPCN